MKYTIVVSDLGNLLKSRPGESLPEKVQKMLDKGWRLQGGMSIGYAGAGGSGGGGGFEHYKWLFGQAMVKD